MKRSDLEKLFEENERIERRIRIIRRIIMFRKFRFPTYVVMGIIMSLAIASIGWSIYQTGDWSGLALNFGTEMVGAIITFWLLGSVVERVQKKELLIAQMSSKIHDIAIQAVEEMRLYKWLFDASLVGASLNSARLWEADLRNANLQWVELVDANLENADLTGAKLQGADLQGANLSKTCLRKANLQNAVLHDANLKRADLTEASLANVILFGADLEEAHLVRHSFQNVDLLGANLKGADLTEANFGNADLTGVNLEETILFDANLQNAILVKISGKGIHSFKGINLDDPTLDLDTASLIGAKYNKNTQWPDGFDPEAAGAVLEYGYLEKEN